jgi:regulatory LuxR family protein
MNLSRNSGRFASPGISADASAFDQDSGLSVIGNGEALLEISYTPEICPVDATTDSNIWNNLGATCRDRKQRESERTLANFQARLDSLTSHEREVMGLVTGGLMNKQIAGEA